MNSFAGQTAIVTGATRGLGRAVAVALMEAEAAVIGIYRSNEEAATEFAAFSQAKGWNLRLVRLDVTDYAAVQKFHEELDRGGVAPDILVSNSGIRRDAVLAMMKPEDWQAVIDTNLTGCFAMCRFAVLAMMRRRRGRIILMTSPMGRLGFVGQCNYSASKAGQVGLMRSLCKEVASRGITVNCVSPGFIETDLLADLDAKTKEEYRNLVPARRFGRPEEVAAAVLFLASDAAAYINGTVLEVTGGI